MHALPNPFVSDSAAFSPFAAECSASVVMPLADTDAAPISPPVAASVPNSALERAMAADTATAPHLTDPAVAVAGVIAESSMSTGGHQEAPAAPPNSMAAGATDCIGEIFYHARKLCEQAREAFDPDAITGDDERLYQHLKRTVDRNAPHLAVIPNEQAFMDAIDEPPLFLRAMGE